MRARRDPMKTSSLPGPGGAEAQPPAASLAEHMLRSATDGEVAPHEKQAIAEGTSREEDA
ncbi:hypothetical protein DBR21_06220 [Caulobacter sp. HMWF009]|nr:hypothetical protein DBR21_06220 [Caulobacter sp. HMWF009]